MTTRSRFQMLVLVAFFFGLSAVLTAAGEEGTRLVEAGRYAEAVPILQQASSQDPQNVGLHLSLGLAYQHLGRYAEAAEALEKAVRIRPDAAQPRRSLALVFEAMGMEADRKQDAARAAGHWSRARDAWRAFRDLDPSPAAREMADRHLAKIASRP